jgi:hypothetical protein
MLKKLCKCTNVNENDEQKICRNFLSFFSILKTTDGKSRIQIRTNRIRIRQWIRNIDPIPGFTASTALTQEKFLLCLKSMEACGCRSLALVCSLPFASTAAQVLAAIHKFINRSDFDLQVLGTPQSTYICRIQNCV